MKKAAVQICWNGRSETFELRKGLGLQVLSLRQQQPIEYSCRAGDCGICIVNVLEGSEQLSAKTAAEADFLRAMQAEPDERLACQCRILGDCKLEIED